jgi:hypothetical protein
VGKPIDLDDPHQLVNAGDGQVQQRVDILAIEPGAVLEDLAKGAPVVLEPARERARGIELYRVERSADSAGRARQRNAERVAKRVRRVGRDDQDAIAAGRPRDRESGGAGRLADAALASIKDKLGGIKVRSQNLEVRTKRSHFSLSSKL